MERERERERERETDRQTTDRQTDRQTDLIRGREGDEKGMKEGYGLILLKGY